MKNLLLILLSVAFSMNLNAQIDLDNIEVNGYYIVKKGADLKKTLVKNISEIKNSTDAESQFGANFNSERRYAETEDIYYTDIVYDNGLTIYLPENKSMYTGFEVRSADYTLKLSSGQSIRVGMKMDEIRSIFPKSYLNRYVNENNGRISIIVNFSGNLNGEYQIFDSSIVFIFNKEDGVLLEFYSHNPS